MESSIARERNNNAFMVVIYSNAGIKQSIVVFCVASRRRAVSKMNKTDLQGNPF